MALLDGQVALVTAAAGAGIGQATARRFLEEGADIVVTDAHAQRVNEVAEALSKDFEREVLGLEMNVTDRAQVEAAVQETLKRYGRLDILVNNAGINKLQPVWEMSDDNWEMVIGVCLTGTFYTMRAALKPMMEQKSGRIVNIASIAAWAGTTSGEAHYAAAKGGVVSLTRSVAMEVARHGVRVNAIAPGFTYNPFLERIYPPEFFERQRKQAPLGRVGEPLDIANAVVFLVSPLSDYVTGETLCVAGGTFLRS